MKLIELNWVVDIDELAGYASLICELSFISQINGLQNLNYLNEISFIYSL